MSNNNSIAGAIQVIHDSELLGQKFKIYGTFEEPLFLAKDVAEWIEYDASSIHKMLASVDEDEKVRKIIPTPGGPQEMWCLTENGLYEVLMLSRKPIAKQFKSQVKAILKSIRRDGGYLRVAEEDDESTIMAKALRIAEATIERNRARLAEANREIAALAPDAEYTRDVLAASNLHTVNSIAVHLGISAIRLNRFLVEHGLIYKQGDIYCPSCKIRDKGYCDFHVVPYISSSGEKMTREHLKWTEAGRKFVIELWNRQHSIEKGA